MMHKELAMMITGTVFFGVLAAAIPKTLLHKEASMEKGSPVEQQFGSDAPAPEPAVSPRTDLPQLQLDDRSYLASITGPDVWPIRDWGVPEPSLTASSSIVVLAEQEKIIFEKNADARLPIASITKLLTALTALEEGDPEMVIEISPEALAQQGESALAAGDKFTLAQLILFMFLPSSNDAAKQVWLSLGRETFSRRMNEKALALGMKNSSFVSPSGLDDLNHFSSAYDVVLLVKALLNKEFLVKSLGLENVTLLSQGGRSVTIHNSNKLLGKVPRLILGKTGFTPVARETLAAVTEEGESRARIIYVVLGSEDRFGDMEKLIEWTRKAYKF